MPIAASSPNLEQLLPFPLLEQVIKPCLAERVRVEHPDPDELYWMGLLDWKEQYLREAIEIQPAHAESRSLLINWLLGDAEYATHELPYCIIGDPAETLGLLVEAEELLDDSIPEERRRRFMDEIAEQRQKILGFQNEPHETNNSQSD